MMDDFTPIIHRLDGRTIRVWACADAHIGAREADEGALRDFLSRIAQDPDSYLVLVGDLVNNGIKDSLTNVYHETMPPSAQIDKAVELLEPVKGKILGAVGGNHERRTTKAVDVDICHTILTLLGKGDLYRPNMAFVRIILRKGNTMTRYAIMLTHGKSRAKNEKFPAYIEGIDAAIFAHTHTPDVRMPASIRFGTNNKISVHHTVTMTACSWLKAGGYSLSGLYQPPAVSNPQCLELEFANTNNRKGKIRVIW